MDYIAAFPMYDFPELEPETDALWAAIAERLSGMGVPELPRRLTRDIGHFDIWRHPNLLIAQACEYPLATEFAGTPQLVATPRYSAPGCTPGFYRSAIVVRWGEPADALDQMRGRRCVVNERSSNSGMNLLRAAIAPLAQGGPFFGSVLASGSHRLSAEAVAEGDADIAAIDCVTFAHLQRLAPNVTERLRILAWTAPSPSLPFITASRTPNVTIAKIRTALADVIADPALSVVRKQLFLQDFDFAPDPAFSEVLTLAARAQALGYPTLS